MEVIKQFCIRLSDSVFRKKYRNIENRRFIRLRDSISVGMRLVDCQGKKVYSRQIKGSTVNISLEGLCLESSTVTVDGVDIFNDAMSDERNLEIEINIPNSDEKIKALGKVVWLDMTPKVNSFLFKAGVFLNLSETEDREKWHRLVETASRYGAEGPWLLRRVKRFFSSTQQ